MEANFGFNNTTPTEVFMNATEKANNANFAIAVLAIIFVAVIYVPGFLGIDIPTTRPVNFVVHLLFWFSVLGLTTKSEFWTTAVLYVWPVISILGIVALLVAGAHYLAGWKLPYKEWFYAVWFLGAGGIAFWKYWRSFNL